MISEHAILDSSWCCLSFQPQLLILHLSSWPQLYSTPSIYILRFLCFRRYAIASVWNITPISLAPIFYSLKAFSGPSWLTKMPQRFGVLSINNSVLQDKIYLYNSPKDHINLESFHPLFLCILFYPCFISPLLVGLDGISVISSVTVSQISEGSVCSFLFSLWSPFFLV